MAGNGRFENFEEDRAQTTMPEDLRVVTGGGDKDIFENTFVLHEWTAMDPPMSQC